MDQEKILKLFTKFVGGVIDLYGLKCTPIGVEEFGTPNQHLKPSYPIQFKIENPNDDPYFFTIVYEELYEITKEFSEYINIRLTPNVIWDKQPKLYLNDKVRDEIKKVFEAVREIKFTTGSPFTGYSRWSIRIESVGLSPAYFDEDSYYIRNTVVPISATKNGDNVDVNDAINTYLDEYLSTKETYYETEEYYSGVDEIISQYPLLNDTNYIATYYDTKFIR